jgi:hypothetical protein
MMSVLEDGRRGLLPAAAIAIALVSASRLRPDVPAQPPPRVSPSPARREARPDYLRGLKDPQQQPERITQAVESLLKELEIDGAPGVQPSPSGTTAATRDILTNARELDSYLREELNPSASALAFGLLLLGQATHTWNVC